MLTLTQYINEIRNAKTNENLHSIISKEMANIRSLPKEENTQEIKYINLKKCIYTSIISEREELSFIYMTCIDLLASSEFKYKKLAYLGLTIFLDENSELLMLTVNVIKKDLSNKNEFIVINALNAISILYSDYLIPQILNDVLNLIESDNIRIKKRALNTMINIYRKINDKSDYSNNLIESLNKILIKNKVKDNGILLSVIQLYNEISKNEKIEIKDFDSLIKTLIEILNTLINNLDSSETEYEIEGIYNPFLQVKIIELLRNLMKYHDKNLKESNKLNNILASISTNTNFDSNVGKSILYEVVLTIISISLNDELNDIGVNIIFKFLKIENDMNYKKIALNLLNEVSQNKNYVEKYLKKNNDICNALLYNIKTYDSNININENDFISKYFSLLFKLVDKSNIKNIIRETINFILGNIENNFINEEFTTSIFNLLEEYSESYKYEIDTLIQVMKYIGNYFESKTSDLIINLFLKIKELHKYSIMKLLNDIQENFGQKCLVNTTIYLIGELYNEIDKNIYNDNQLIDLFKKCYFKDEENNNYLIDTYFKLLCNKKFNINEELKAFCKSEIEKMTKNYNYEIQERACEYLIFLEKSNFNIDMNIPIYYNKKDKKNLNQNKVIYNPEFDEENEETLKYIKEELKMKIFEEENEVFQFVNNINVKKPKVIEKENADNNNDINLFDFNVTNSEKENKDNNNILDLNFTNENKIETNILNLNTISNEVIDNNNDNNDNNNNINNNNNTLNENKENNNIYIFDFNVSNNENENINNKDLNDQFDFILDEKEEKKE